MTPPIFRIDLELWITVIVRGVNSIHQNGYRLLDVVVFKRKADVVAQDLPDPEA